MDTSNDSLAGRLDDPEWRLSSDCEPAEPCQLAEPLEPSRPSYAALALAREIAASRRWEASGKDPNWWRQNTEPTPSPSLIAEESAVRRWRNESETLRGRDVLTPDGMGMFLGVATSGLIHAAVPPDFYSIQKFPANQVRLMEVEKVPRTEEACDRESS